MQTQGAQPVLLADDDAFVREVIADILQGEGYAVTSVADGVEAMEAVQSSNAEFALVISDLNMPHVDGLELVGRIRELGMLIPIIMLTSNDEMAVVRKAIALGADDYLIKDENIDSTIIFSVTKVLGRYELIRQNLKMLEEIRQKNSLLEALNQKLEEATQTDPLTGLNNRRFVSQNILQDLALVHRRYHDLKHSGGNPENRDMLFMMVDIDHFKQVNDTYGHAAGDQVLVQFSQILRDSCRTSDIIVRWGGEEFLVICRDSTVKYGRVIAERIRSNVERFNFGIGAEATINKTCSLGFSCFPLDVSEPQRFSWEHVIDLADQALYAAKKSRRNCWVSLTVVTPTNAEFAHCIDQHSASEWIAKGCLNVETSLPSTTSLIWK